MPFTHKLSRRLSLLRDAMLLVAVAAVSACTDGSPLGSEFGPSAGTDSPANPSQIVGMLATSDNPTVEPEQSTRLRVVAIRADGLRQPVEAEWEAIDGGELRDTVVDGKTITNFRAKEPGEYRLVSYDRGKKFRDTTRVTVPRGNSVSIAKMYLVPAVVSLVAGQGQQFFVYGTTTAGDSVPLVASLNTAEGGVASGLHYTAGSTPGSYQVIASRQGGPEVDTALVSIQAADTPPASEPPAGEPQPTDPISDPVPTAPAPTDPAPYQPSPSSSVAELPRVYLDTRFVAPTGRTIVVPAGGDFQGALNAAARGDVVELAAGATYTGNFVLPQKSGSGWVTIRTATALPPEGTRITPQSAASFAKIRSTNSMPAIRTAAGGGASYYRLMGLDIGSNASMTYALVHIGDYDNTATSVDMLPTHVYLDRVFVHGTPTQGIQRCVVLNSRSSAVVDSWLSECHMKGFDTQAIVGWNGPGPFKIVNNHLAGAGENVMFGGADPRIQGLTPTDIEIRRNHFYKPLEWKASGAWTVKNLFELKNSRRVLVEENIFENNWSDAQTGFAIVLKSINDGGRCTWCVTEQVTFRYNKIINSPGGVNIVAVQAYNGGGAVPAHNMDIGHNVFEDVGLSSQPGSKRIFQMLGPLSAIRVAHNTAFGEDVIVMFDGGANQDIAIQNNLFTRGNYGIFGSSKGEGKSALGYYAPNSSVTGNVLVGAPATIYPEGNYFPTGTLVVGMTDYAGGDYSLLSSSPYATAGTDGGAPGADVTELRRRLEGVK